MWDASVIWMFRLTRLATNLNTICMFRCLLGTHTLTPMHVSGEAPYCILQMDLILRSKVNFKCTPKHALGYSRSSCMLGLLCVLEHFTGIHENRNSLKLFEPRQLIFFCFVVFLLYSQRRQPFYNLFKIFWIK